MIRGSKTSPAPSPYRSYNLEGPRLAITYGRSKGKVYFFEAIFDYLRYFEKKYDESAVVKSFHLVSISQILTSILQDRKSSTSSEDLAVFAATVSHSDTVQDERASNKPIFQLFDKFSLLESCFFDIQYMFTMMLSQSLDYYFETEDWICLRNMQSYSLTYSI